MIDKNAIREQFRRHERDTGSSEVQIATLTKRIEQLTEHLKANKKDNSSRYGLIRMVNNRRKLLDYLKRTNEESYRKTPLYPPPSRATLLATPPSRCRPASGTRLATPSLNWRM